MATEIPSLSIKYSLKRWTKSLPASPMIFPDSLGDRMKYFFWRVYTPFHPTLRDGILFLGFGSQSDSYPQGRQPYVLGKLAPEQSLQDFTDYLISKGFGNHFIAWEDRGQVVSLRYLDDFKYQYHLRVFQDGEVRGHYEYTPECHPVAHLKAISLEPRREKFLEFLGDRIIVSE
jgi:hypothetical protein